MNTSLANLTLAEVIDTQNEIIKKQADIIERQSSLLLQILPEDDETMKDIARQTEEAERKKSRIE